MTERNIPQQRTGEELKESIRVVNRVGELALEMKPDGSDSELKKQLDEEYGPGGWATREAAPRTTEEHLIQNAGILILEVYVKDE